MKILLLVVAFATITVAQITSIPSATGSGGGGPFPQTVSGTVNSGGIPYFSNTTTMSSSATMTLNAIIKGGGAGASPIASGVAIDSSNNVSGATSIALGGGGPAITPGTGAVWGGSLGTVPGTCAASSVGCVYMDSGTQLLLYSRNNGAYLPLNTMATSDLTGQSAAQSATALFTPPASGTYRVSYYAKITTPDSTGSVLGGTTGFVVNYTDGTDSVAQTLTVIELNQSGAVVTIGTGNTTNTTAAVVYGSTMVYAKTGVAMTYNFGFSRTNGNGLYEIHVKVEAL